MHFLTPPILIIAITLLFLPLWVHSKDVYQTPEDFIEEVYAGSPPRSKKLWIRKDLKRQIREILQHDFGVLRIRYWEKSGRTAWILDEIGKEKPITTGIVINDNKVELIRVLVFRESRGWEIRYPFFTDQFKNVALSETLGLDKSIDGISGATLSVNALKKLARLSLLLHGYSFGNLEVGMNK